MRTLKVDVVVVHRNRRMEAGFLDKQGTASRSCFLYVCDAPPTGQPHKFLPQLAPIQTLRVDSERASETEGKITSQYHTLNQDHIIGFYSHITKLHYNPIVQIC